MWVIPMSRRIDKYQAIVNKDIERYGKCIKIFIGEYANKQNAFLFQNMFPILPKYIDHIHMIQQNPVPVRQQLQTTLDRNFREVLRLHKLGAKVVFPDITRLEKLMLVELAADTGTGRKPFQRELVENRMKYDKFGEQYAHLELIRNGYAYSYLANSSTQEGWDIACFIEDGEVYRLVKLQVKTHNWKSECSHAIQFSPKADFDFLVMVILNYNANYTTYVIPKSKLKAKTDKEPLFHDGYIMYSKQTGNKPVTITITKLDSFEVEMRKHFQDKWELLSDVK